MAKVATLIASTSAAVNITGGAFKLGDYTGCQIDAVFSGGGGDLAGTIKIQVSGDGTNFSDLTGASAAVTASAYTIFDINTNAQYVRPVWTASSGTGNLVSTITVKESNSVQLGG